MKLLLVLLALLLLAGARRGHLGGVREVNNEAGGILLSVVLEALEVGLWELVILL